MSMSFMRRDGRGLLLALALWLLALAAPPVLAQAEPGDEPVQRQLREQTRQRGEFQPGEEIRESEQVRQREQVGQREQTRQRERERAGPLNDAPMWRQARSGEAFFTTVRGPETGVLIQSEGNTWRQLRNGPIKQYGSALLLVVLLALAVFYAVKGIIRLHAAPTGRRIQRFSVFERVVHWGTAITFVLLAVTGLAILFAKHFVAPLLGHDALGVLLVVGKNIHNYIGPVFLVFTVLMILAFARDNLWEASDRVWIRKGGGFISGEHVPSGRFNFGEKAWFWGGVAFLGLIVAGSGLVLDFPNFGQLRVTMQWANVIHATASILLIAMSFAHIYLGTIGLEGAYGAMRTGYVDETWAKEHHALWYEDVKAGKPRHS
ncbi:formate dehydrogenase subunit gamma [Aromatoleum buckelii]|uniref:Formate dehydrogenase subunit gamma n=1 Tax=Aromatoleum buckelii TaxID=200254 RepID=A0ABX1MZ44_9RHOO|nr:formate dehydrogenase subunit gamma [Aromatoleum buckelii]MCK0510120.1 formate dehydrogenase subunit gamma [Aromatoleum buckelii]